MTVQKPPFNIKSIAIIGAGPSGIASVYELTRLTKDGKSLFGEKDISGYKDQLMFEKVVAFERNATVGGVWSKSVFHENNPDPQLPDFEYIGDLVVPETIYKKFQIIPQFEEKLNNSSFASPISTPIDESAFKTIQHQWRGSGAYKDLFTNVTNQFMNYSFAELSPEELENINTKYKHIPMHEKAEDVSEYLESVVNENHLAPYIRLNSNIERVRKLSSGKWEILVSSVQPNGTILWYKELYDAVVLGTGKSVPYIPQIDGLRDFVKTNKDVVDIRLAKTVKNPKYLREKGKILVVGSSVSAVDLLQYAFPRDLDNTNLFISRNSPQGPHSWINDCLYSKGINNKPAIKEFLPEQNAVKFLDGSIESNFDAIIFATGYQTIYPYLETEKSQKLLDFYKYTFSIGDDTLALVGNTYTSFFFNRVEAQAAALAGVWGNLTHLPPTEQQIDEYEGAKPLLITPLVDKNFISPLMKLAPKGRPHPFDVNPNKSDHTILTGKGQEHILSLWIEIRNGKVDPEAIFQ